MHIFFFNLNLFKFIIVTIIYVEQFIVFNNILFNLNLIRILFYRSTLVRYDLSAIYMSLLMFYLYVLYINLNISM